MNKSGAKNTRRPWNSFTPLTFSSAMSKTALGEKFSIKSRHLDIPCVRGCLQRVDQIQKKIRHVVVCGAPCLSSAAPSRGTTFRDRSPEQRLFGSQDLNRLFLARTALDKTAAFTDKELWGEMPTPPLIQGCGRLTEIACDHKAVRFRFGRSGILASGSKKKGTHF